MKIFVDVDNTICKTKGTDYANAKPIKKKIAICRRKNLIFVCFFIFLISNWEKSLLQVQKDINPFIQSSQGGKQLACTHQT